jgi:hypothetical protein
MEEIYSSQRRLELGPQDITFQKASSIICGSLYGAIWLRGNTKCVTVHVTKVRNSGQRTPLNTVHSY